MNTSSCLFPSECMYIYLYLNEILPFDHPISSSAVVVNFSENSYTVDESDGQVSVSLRIDGQFFFPVWAVVEISDGTATGGLCMSLGM